MKELGDGSGFLNFLSAIKTRTVPLFLIWCLVLGISALYAEDKIIAVVNNEIITQKDLDDFVNFMRMQLSTKFKGQDLESKIQTIKLDLLDKLVEDRLILQEARRSDIKIDENRIKAKIDEVKKNYPTDAEFQKSLKSQGLVQADLEAKIKEQFLMYGIIELKVKSKIKINPAEVTDFYQQNLDEFQFPEERHYKTIKIDDELLADKIRGEIKRNITLEDLAKQYSLKVNKVTVTQKELKKEIAGQIFNLNLGETSPLIKNEGNYYVFQLEEITPPALEKLPDVQDQIYTFLLDKKMQYELTLWLDELKKHSYIKILSS